MERELSAPELEYYYHGLYRVLKRYRTATIAGWGIVLAGVISIPMSWGAGRGHGLLDLALAGVAIAGGLILVSEAISFLDAYLSVPFRSAPNEDAGDDPEVLREITSMIDEVRSGGWQEAYAAIDRLRGLAGTYPLAPLEQ